MIIIKILGDLSSQLHKYVIGKDLTLKYNSKLKLNISWYDNIQITDTVREYQLNKHYIDVSIATKNTIKYFEEKIDIFVLLVFLDDLPWVKENIIFMENLK